MAYFNTYQSRSLMHLTELEDYPFWLALYSDRMTFPYRIEMWQYTDSGKVPGIEGKVDLNLMFTEEYF
jgi:GH25 family lysozyme M1 (1,4-beta-N-acetylmuramidase)